MVVEDRRELHHAAVVLRMISVKAGVHEDCVPGLHARTACRDGIAASTVIVVSAHQRVKGGLDLGSFVVRMVDVVYLASRIWLRFRESAHDNCSGDEISAASKKPVRDRKITRL